MSAPQPAAPPEPTVPPAIVSLPDSANAVDSTSVSVVPAESTASSSALPEAMSPIAGPAELPDDKLAVADNIPASWLWLTKLDQTFVAVFVAVFLLLTGYHWATLGGWGMRPIELERQPARQYDFRFDINSASWVEWTQIEGIGEVTAQKIIAHRDANGPFRKIDDLLRVKGIGPKTLEKMRPFLLEPNERPMPKKSTR